MKPVLKEVNILISCKNELNSKTVNNRIIKQSIMTRGNGACVMLFLQADKLLHSCGRLVKYVKGETGRHCWSLVSTAFWSKSIFSFYYVGCSLCKKSLKSALKGFSG